MTCGIYKIENKVDGKVYIGQSINIERRWIGHKKTIHGCSDAYNYPLYRAIRKDGIDNFDFSIIEECSKEELNEKEKIYIKKYNSLVPIGYNQTSGGQDNFGHPMKLTFEQVQEIRILLEETILSNEEISKLYDVSETLISAINTGYYWHDSDIEYPIRVPKDCISYRGENGITYYKKIKYCSVCGKEIYFENKSGMCKNCLVQEKRKKNWPDRETLKQLIRTIPLKQISEKYGYKGSSNTPKKWCIAYNLPYRKCDIEKISDEDWELI